MAGEWEPLPFPGPVTHVGAWVHGHGSVSFPGGKIKVIPAETGVLQKKFVYPDGSRRTPPYFKHKPGAPTHMSKRWIAVNLGVPEIVPNRQHPVVMHSVCFDQMRRRRDGVEFRCSPNGHTASLTCEFTKSTAPDVQLAVLPGDPEDDTCIECWTKKAPKRCLQKKCGRHCLLPDCNAHIR
mmetsp:Transcript_36099/g.71045  ORF Transcript_36099/g.71045 Transcript_36099/m.71045 type:complete len:181 (-) Transcript_36099:611-1153(-)